MNQNLKLIVKIAIPCVIFVIVILYLRGIQFDWNTWQRLTCQINGGCNDCDKDLEGSLIRELVNTLSNVIYLIVGLYIYFKYTEISKVHRITILIGFCGVALGSVFYHASTTLAGLISDFLGINILLVSLTIYSFESKFGEDLRFYVAGVAYLLTFLGLNLLLPESDILKFLGTGIVATVLILTLLKNIWTKEFIFAVLLYILGLFFWSLDNIGILCFPESIFQLHSFWHICVALSGLWIVKIIRKISLVLQ